MAIVHIPGVLHSLTGNVQKQAVNGNTVGELIDQLDLLFPGIKNRLLENDRLRSGLTVFVDGLVRQEGLKYKVEAEREVFFVPAVAGGSKLLDEDC